MDTSVLEDIGLTGAETKVLTALIGLGSSTAGPIVEKSGLQNAVVHRSLHSLIEKGLVTYILEGKKKRYQATNPKYLLNFLDEKRQRLEVLLPKLIAKSNTANEKPMARTFQGVRGIKELLHELLETDKKEYAAFGGPKKANDLLGEYFWEAFHTKRIQKKIVAKLLFHTSLEKWGFELKKKRLTQVKLTSREFESLTETIVCGDKIGIVIYLEKPYGLLLQNEVAAESYKSFFNSLWNQSKS